MASPTHGISEDQIGRWYRPVRWAAAPLRRWLDITVVDQANVPHRGGVILAANHLSFLDSPLLMHLLPRPVTLLGKAEYLRHPATRALFPRAGMIPIDRSGRGVARSLRHAAERLRAGEIVGLFPEGTRSRDGLLHRGHSGVAHLALRSGCPIVPVGIRGTADAMPPGCRLPRRAAPITVRFGAPIDLGRWAGAGANAAVKREVTDEVMDAIAALSGQTRSDRFAVSPDLAAA